jgi:hypothetical protein
LLLVVSQPNTGSKIINCLLSTHIKQENAKREYNDKNIFKKFFPTGFSFSFVSFFASPKINKKRKVESFFRQAYFVAFTKLMKVA